MIHRHINIWVYVRVDHQLSGTLFHMRESPESGPKIFFTDTLESLDFSANYQQRTLRIMRDISCYTA